MIPYHDENATDRTAVVTLGLIAMNVVTWLVVQGAGEFMALSRSVCNLGLIPGELTLQAAIGSEFVMGRTREGVLVCTTDAGRQASHLFTSMFLHGSWMHIIGNMWFLWLFGNNIEDSMTRPRFIAFYLVCGLAAAFAQIAANPASAIPMVGASGAISGVMGAYLVMYPRVRVWTLVPLGFFLTNIALPAWMMLVYWFAIQFFSGLVSIGEEGGGVAFWAHAGGFVAGLVLANVFARRDLISAHRSHPWRPERVGWR